MTERIGPTRSLRRRSRQVLGGAVAAAVLASASGAVALDGLLDSRRRLVDQVDPARLELLRLRAALSDQERAVRAYVLSAEPAYLEPYDAGLVAEARSRAMLQPLVPAGEAQDAAAALDAAIERWRQDYAVRTIGAVTAGGDPAGRDGAAAPEPLAEGEARFDEIRSAGDRLERQLGAERDEAAQRLATATRRLVLTLLAAEAVLLGVAFGSWWLLRRSVQRPLSTLRIDAAAVAAGESSRPVQPVGPHELYELGEAMEAMRLRIAAELAAATEASEELRRQQRELTRSNAELEQFAYVASHDLQEPLRKVAAFCQLLQSRYGGQLDERADQYIGFAVDGAKRMQALINDLLAFSRVGRVTREFAPVELDVVLHEAQDNLGEAFDGSGAVLEADPLPAVPGEHALLVAVFQNLLGNALKFRRPGVVPHITVRHRAGDGCHRIVVRDNGIGIDPEYAERVFVIFQRLHAKEDYPGTGIGLALCRKIVEHHGGEIAVVAAAAGDGDGDDACGEPVGTAVEFTLPALAATEPEPDQTELLHPEPLQTDLLQTDLLQTDVLQTDLLQTETGASR